MSETEILRYKIGKGYLAEKLQIFSGKNGKRKNTSLKR